MLTKYIKDKSIGFWFCAAITLLSLVTSIVYAVCYAGSDNINWGSFAFMLAAAAAAVVLTVLKKHRLASYVQAFLVFMALLFFIYGIYYYISVVMVGIDLDSFTPEFIVCTILYLLAFGLSVANVFLKQTKDSGEVNGNE